MTKPKPKTNLSASLKQTAAAKGPGRTRPERIGRKALVTYVEEDLHLELRIAALRKKMTMQQVGEEALLIWLYNHANEENGD